MQMRNLKFKPLKVSDLKSISKVFLNPQPNTGCNFAETTKVETPLFRFHFYNSYFL
jgi:hypothetical protein